VQKLAGDFVFVVWQIAQELQMRPMFACQVAWWQ